MTNVVIPSPGESITEVTLGAWQKQDGEWVEKDELLCEIESDKATLELLAPAAGVLSLGVKGGSEQKVGSVVARIDESAARPAGAKAAAGAGAKAAAPAAAAAAGAVGAGGSATAVAEPKATSVARKMAADKGVNLTGMAGSGPGGRVTKADVERAAGGSNAAPAAASPAAASSPAPSASPAPAAAPLPGSRAARRERMPKIRQRIAARLVESQQSTATLTTFNEVDMSEVMRLRTEHKDSFEKRHGVGLGFMGFFVKAAISALQRYPRVNAFIVGDEFEYHDYYDIAVAVGTLMAAPARTPRPRRRGRSRTSTTRTPSTRSSTGPGA